MQDLLSVAWVCNSNLSQVLVLHYIAPLYCKIQKKKKVMKINDMSLLFY